MSNFSDHAANERTFLAWLRTGIAIIAFGFVVEKFNIFLSSLMGANDELGRLIRLDRASGPLGRRSRPYGHGYCRHRLELCSVYSRQA
jgi:hypothetical protein